MELENKSGHELEIESSSSSSSSPSMTMINQESSSHDDPLQSEAAANQIALRDTNWKDIPISLLSLNMTLWNVQVAFTRNTI